MSDKVNCQAYEIDYKKVVQENQKYKSLEDDLGCPLDVVANKKAMVVKDSELYEVDIMAVSFTNGNIYFGNEWSFTTKKLKDYKKTWFLKEDLSE